MYIQQGGVKLSVLSKAGREAVVAMLGPGDFFGEGCLAGQPVRIGSATAITATSVLVIAKKQMVNVLHEQHALSDRFIAHMLSRNIRIEQDLVDQLFNSSEKRLARTLLLLARYGKPDKPRQVVPKISQETLAEMVGTTRSRVNFFMNKFKKLGFIEYNGDLEAGIADQQLAAECRPARLRGPVSRLTLRGERSVMGKHNVSVRPCRSLRPTPVVRPGRQAAERVAPPFRGTRSPK